MVSELLVLRDNITCESFTLLWRAQTFWFLHMFPKMPLMLWKKIFVIRDAVVQKAIVDKPVNPWFCFFHFENFNHYYLSLSGNMWAGKEILNSFQKWENMFGSKDLPTVQKQKYRSNRSKSRMLVQGQCTLLKQENF